MQNLYTYKEDKNYYIFLASTLFINVSILSTSIFFWKIFWLEEFSCYIPNMADDFREESKYSEGNCYKATTITEVYQQFRRILTNLNKVYWINNCGFDSLGLILYQRKLLKSLSYFSIIYLALLLLWLIFKNFFLNEYQLLFVEVNIIPNEDFIVTSGLILIIFYNLTELRDELKDLYKKDFENDKNLTKSNQLRTIHLRGIPLDDYKGNYTMFEILKKLHDLGDQGTIKSITIIPEYSKLLYLENKRLTNEYQQRLFEANEPYIRKYCFPKKFTTLEYHNLQGTIIVNQAKQSKLEDNISYQLEQEYQLSGHAFICLNNMISLQKLVKSFSESKNYCIVIWYTIKDHCILCCHWLKEKLCNSQSNDYENFQFSHRLICQQAPDPFDINWINITQERGFIKFRLILFNLLIFFMLLFVTTPYVNKFKSQYKTIYYFLSQIPSLSFLSFKWTKQVPEPFAQLINNNIPALFVISINQLILLLLDLISFNENHFTHSSYQISLLKKMFFYLMINVLIIPVFFFYSSDNLFQIIKKEFDLKFQYQFHNSYFLEIGVINFIIHVKAYFFTFIIQSGSCSFLMQLYRPNEIFYYYLSPHFAYFMRVYENDQLQSRRPNEFPFQFGYIGAQMLLILAIVCVFCTSNPLILIAGMYFFLTRHLTDSYAFLIYNKIEIESNGRFISTIFMLTGITLSLWVLLKIFTYWLHGNMLILSIFTGELVLCIMITIFLSENIFYQSVRSSDLSHSPNPMTSNQRIVPKIAKTEEKSTIEWRKMYGHPLLTGYNYQDQDLDTIEEGSEESKRMSSFEEMSCSNMEFKLKISLSEDL